MGYLLTGVIVTSASIGGLWFSLPGADGQIKPFARNGLDAWLAVMVTVGVALGLGALVVGIVELVG